MPPKTQALRGIVLDVDGVIADTIEEHDAAIRMALRSYGFDQLAQQSYRAQLTNFSSEKIFRNLLITGALAIPKGFTEGDAFIRAIYARKTEFYTHAIELDIKSKSLQARPGIEGLIIEADENRVPMAIGSASNISAVSALINGLGLHGYLDKNTVTHKTDHKPSPATYRSALELLDISESNAAQVVAFEDTFFGALSALSAGLHVVVTRSSYTDTDRINRLAKDGLTQTDIKINFGDRITPAYAQTLLGKGSAQKLLAVVDNLEKGGITIEYLDEMLAKRR